MTRTEGQSEPAAGEQPSMEPTVAEPTVEASAESTVPEPTVLEPFGGDWQRVSPRYLLVDVIGIAIFGLLATGVAVAWPLLVPIPLLWLPPIVVALVFLTVLAFTPRRVRAIGYRLREDDLLFRRGVLFRRVVAVPYGRMQLIDLTRGPIARLLGLSELKFVTAAAATNVVIPGLPQEEAEQLRDRLVALAETRRAGL